MFTLTQIHDAHSKVQSWAEFPAYIQDLIQLWVRSYIIYVSDWHAVYHGDDDYAITSPVWYDILTITPTVDKSWFIAKLQAHQQWLTDYMTFCQDAADAGIAYWIMDLQTMKCIYCDSSDNHILVEIIPH